MKKTLLLSFTRRYIALLEVLIAFSILVLCALPLIYIQVAVIKSEKQFLDVVELDHAANLIFASILQNLYERKIPLPDIVSNKEIEIAQQWLEQAGFSRQNPYTATYQFLLKLKKPPQPEEKELMLYQLILTFTEMPKAEKQIKYEYLVFIEHKLK